MTLPLSNWTAYEPPTDAIPAAETLPDIPNDWLYPPNLQRAADVQRELSERVIQVDDLPASIATLGGVDVSNNVYDPSQMVYAALVLLNTPQLHVTGQAVHSAQASLPYQPGFLGFREAPVLIEAYRKLTVPPPDLIFVDGHGVSHPRGLGIASHIGVLLNKPTIGVAKSILVGYPDGELGENPGDTVPLVWKNRQIGVVLRSKSRCNPLYISNGHRISLDTAVKWVKQCLTRYRLPEPTRQAHEASNAFRRQYLSSTYSENQ